MEVIFNSFLLVAVAEMGDKTQLLAFVLASRFKNPSAVLAGIFVATVFNHVLAALGGKWVSELIPALYLAWILGAIFIIFAAWILIPDKDDETSSSYRFGPFLTTTIVFFLAEMGDKTQLATVALAATYSSVLLVTLGTTMGMMFSDGLAVLFGERLTEKISMKWIRWISAGIFFIFGVMIIIGTY
jgi:Ca2+/H+ antiporter, TMEM165/GDT1 family